MTVGKIHLTQRFARERQANPNEFVKGTLRIVHQGQHEIIVGKKKTTGKYAAQSILHPRGEYA